MLEPTQRYRSVNANPAGPRPGRIFFTTRFTLGLIRETRELALSLVQTDPNANVTSYGSSPTRIRLTTSMRSGSIRSTRLKPKLAAQTLPAPAARPHGCRLTGTVPTTAFTAGSIRVSPAEPKFATQTLPKAPSGTQGAVPVSILATTWGSEADSAAPAQPVNARAASAAAGARRRARFGEAFDRCGIRRCPWI